MDYDVIIIGAGPAGYVAAIRAGQVGLRTAIIEKKYIGGMCLNWGCIPVKTIIESAKVFDKIKKISVFGIDGVDESMFVFNWEKVKNRSREITKKLSEGITELLKKNGVDIVTGEAIITDDHSVVVNNRTLKTTNIIIATGSKPASVYLPNDKNIVQSMEFLFDLKEIPENIIIFGNGISSVEMAQFFKLIGKTVTLISQKKDFLPGLDLYLKSFIINKMKSENIELIIDKTANKYENGYLHVNDKNIKCDIIINCNKRNAIIPQSEIALELDENDYIKTNENFETSRKGIYAIGDVNGISFLANLASAQGIWLINKIKGINNEFIITDYPYNFYTVPEIAQIGMTEQQLEEKNIEFKINEFSLSANGKALIEDNTEGFMRILSDNKYGQVLGVQIVAANATDMISEAAAFMQIEGTVYDVVQAIHTHPTVSRIFMEAGFDLVNKVIHK